MKTGAEGFHGSLKPNIEGLLCARDCARYFTYTPNYSLKPSKRELLLFHFDR